MKSLLALTLAGLLAWFSPLQTHSLQLQPGHWNPHTRQQLEQLLTIHSGQARKVVFDFDNTLISRDIGEATFAELLRTGMIRVSPALKAISPDFRLGSQLISLDTVDNLATYYDALAALDSHPEDVEAPANSYAWMVQAMQGLTPAQIIAATRQVYANNQAESDRFTGQETWVELAPGQRAYRVPFFNPELIDLVAQLLRHGYDLYVVSGSNVWTVRHMVCVELMKRVNARLGTYYQIPADHVIGASVLLRDKRTGRLVKDLFLSRENSRYAALDPEELNQYELTNQVVFPLTGFSGKVATIQQFITGPQERPFLVAGDSNGDFAMLQQAQYRLWFARLEKKAYQQSLSRLVQRPERATWMIQPVLTTRRPGLIQNQAHLEALARLGGEPLPLQEWLETLKIWREEGLYRD